MSEITDAQALRTERLSLVPLAEEHIDAMFDLSIDPQVRRYLWEEEVTSKSQVQRTIAESQACFEQWGSGFYAMVLASDDSADDLVDTAFVPEELYPFGQ